MRPITAFISDISKASGKAKALLKAISRAEGVTARIEIALYPNDGGTFEELYDNADVAMYRAKARGGNCYEFHRGAENWSGSH
ncbi:diguanylate cyclase domain-containing protein [Cloacibacillus evryensis]|uniref:diguanylate cyclase domain-containing protein n=1 Tax=Cloacibacillus evryensis TaxID=508460 RepID=UPI0004AD7D8C